VPHDRAPCRPDRLHSFGGNAGLRRSGTAVGKLLIYGTDLLQFVESETAKVVLSMTCTVVADELDCESAVVCTLLPDGFLQGRRIGYGWEVKRDSVAEFVRQYIRLSEIAESLATSSRGISAVCESGGVQLLHVRHRDRAIRNFARREMVPKIINACSMSR
jgi:hypothetical protein